jgi:hypothetical protein
MTANGEKQMAIDRGPLLCAKGIVSRRMNASAAEDWDWSAIGAVQR